MTLQQNIALLVWQLLQQGKLIVLPEKAAAVLHNVFFVAYVLLCRGGDKLQESICSELSGHCSVGVHVLQVGREGQPVIGGIACDGFPEAASAQSDIAHDRPEFHVIHEPVSGGERVEFMEKFNE